MHKIVVALVLASCGSSSPAPGRAEQPAPSCAARLASLKQFYEAAGLEQTGSPPHAGLETAHELAQIKSLVKLEGPAADTSRSDILVIGPAKAAWLRDAAEPQILDDAEHALVPPGPGRALVLQIAADAPLATVTAWLKAIARAQDRYASVAIGYTTDGAFAGRTMPTAPGIASGAVDAAAYGGALGDTTTAHCKPIADKLAGIGEGTTAFDATLLTALAPLLPGCDCATDLGTLEALPWVLRHDVTTLVPLAATAPALPASGTWGDFAIANHGAPPAVSLPQPPPPPPPPHR